MIDSMTDGAWFKANPTRRYRIRRRGDVDGVGLAGVGIVKIADDRKMWSTRNIKMRNELPDTDEAAELALREHEFIITAQLGELNGRTVSVLDVLSMLRQDTP